MRIYEQALSAAQILALYKTLANAIYNITDSGSSIDSGGGSRAGYGTSNNGTGQLWIWDGSHLISVGTAENSGIANAYISDSGSGANVNSTADTWTLAGSANAFSIRIIGLAII